jgi:hypothetical protein
MIVLTTAEAQWIYIIPTRQFDEDLNDIYVDIIDETTKQEYINIPISTFAIGDLFQIDFMTLDFLKENTFYNIKVYFGATNEVIYKDRMFCTDQPLYGTFSINNGEYILPTINNNTYITI